MVIRATFYPNHVYRSGSSDVQVSGELVNGVLMPGMKSQDQQLWQVEWVQVAGRYTDIIESGVREAQFVVLKIMNATTDIVEQYIKRVAPMRFYY